MLRRHTEENLAEARKLLVEGLPVTQISLRTGIPVSTLRYHLAETKRALAASNSPLMRPRMLGKNARPLLIARLWATAERQITEIDTRLAEADGDPATLERDAKTLSILARTVRDLVALEDKPVKKAESPHADAEMPKDIDGFRRELAQKLVELGRSERGA